MVDDPKPESPEADEAEFDRVLRNLVNTPHKPHGGKAKVRDNEREASSD
jgi:hypothetical protein